MSGRTIYAYVGGNPIAHVDPLGLQAITLPGAGIGAGAAAAGGVRPGTLVDPIATPADPGGGGDWNQKNKCWRMQKRIENLKKEIYEKRYPDLASNPNGLPRRIGPGELLRETVRGHEILLTIKLRELKNLEEAFDKECDCIMSLLDSLYLGQSVGSLGATSDYVGLVALAFGGRSQQRQDGQAQGIAAQVLNELS